MLNVGWAKGELEEVMLDRSSTGVFVLRSDFTVAHWSRRMEAWTNVSSEKIVGQDIRERFPELGKGVGYKAIQSVVAGGPPVVLSSQIHGYLLPIPAPAEGLRKQHATISSLPGSADTANDVLVMVEDVTDLSVCWDKLAEAERRARTECVAKQKAEAELRAINEGMEKWIDERRSELASTNATLKQQVAAREKAESALRQSYRQVKELITAMPSIVVWIDPAERIVEWNPAASSILGLSAEKAVGGSLADVPLEWDLATVQDGIGTARHTGGTVRLPDCRFVRPDGSSGLLGLTVTGISRDCEVSGGVLVLGADITERRMLENQLDQDQKLEAMRQMAGGVVRKVSTPIRCVGRNIDFIGENFAAVAESVGMLRRLTDSVDRKGRADQQSVSELRAYLDQKDIEYLCIEINRAVEQAEGRVEDVAEVLRVLGDYSHADKAAAKGVDVNKAIGGILSLFGNEWKRVGAVRTNYDVSLPPVLCVAGDLNQVLLSILVNACEAMEKVSDQRGANKQLLVISTRSRGTWAEIRISDTGCGIPEDIAPQVFDLFFSTKSSVNPCGYGLTISKAIIEEKYGGTLTFDTEVGIGSTFVIRLPLEEEQAGDKIADADGH